MHIIDLDTYPRRELFRCFRHHDQPTLSITCEVEVTALRRRQQADGRRCFASLCHGLMQAVQAVPAFRHRFHGEGLCVYETVDLAVTVARPDQTFAFCSAPWQPELGVFHDELCARMAAAVVEPDYGNDGKQGTVFITSLPWLAFTGITHPVATALADIPILTIGKLSERDGRVIMPLAVQAHHALVDGLHVAQLVAAFDAYVADCAEMVQRG